MASFEELLEAARNAEEPNPTIYDDLGAAYNDFSGGASARIAELEAAKSAADAELQRVRAHNYELLTAVPSGNSPAVSQGISQETEPDVPEITLDDIISYD